MSKLEKGIKKVVEELEEMKKRLLELELEYAERSPSASEDKKRIAIITHAIGQTRKEIMNLHGLLLRDMANYKTGFKKAA